jgi:hypothetical protein
VARVEQKERANIPWGTNRRNPIILGYGTDAFIG